MAERKVPDPAILRASLVLSERYVESQLTLADGRLRKAEALVRLSVAGLAGILAMIGLLVNIAFRLDAVALFGFGPGVLSNLVALVLFLSTVSGFPRPYAYNLGPRLKTLMARFVHEESDFPTFQVSVLAELDRAIENNDAVGGRLDARCSRGTLWLVVAVFFHACALA